MRIMKNVLLIFISLFISQFAFSQSDSTKAKIYRNDTLAARLGNSAETITIDDASYFLKCTFTHSASQRGKKKPYYWNIFLRSSKASSLPPNIKQLKLYIITDTLIYEFSYLPISYCWNKTIDLYPKPLIVVEEFIDTKTNKKYLVKSKGPFTKPKRQPARKPSRKKK
jgi:hypothetical protein